MWALQAASALPFGTPRVFTQSRKSRTWNVAGYLSISSTVRPASSVGELRTYLPLSPASTQPVSPSNRTGHEPSGIQPSSRKISSTPLAYLHEMRPSLGGLYSTGGGQSFTAHWHRSTQCEPHSSTPPPIVLRPLASTVKPPIMPPPF